MSKVENREMLLCGRADEVAALAASPCSKRVRDGEDGGDQEESKDRHLGGIRLMSLLLIDDKQLLLKSFFTFQ